MEDSYFPALLVLKSLRVICSVSGLFMMLVLSGTPEPKVGPHEPPRKFSKNGGILLFTSNLVSLVMLCELEKSQQSIFFYLIALIKCSIDCTVYFVKVCSDCESNKLSKVH